MFNKVVLKKEKKMNITRLNDNFFKKHLPPLKWTYYWCVTQIQSCNRHAIRANVNQPTDVNVCHTNDSYKVKTMLERKLC